MDTLKAENDNIKEEEFEPDELRMVWAARETLTDEQMEILIQSIRKSK